MNISLFINKSFANLRNIDKIIFMKGISKFVSYSLTVLIGFIVLAFFVSLINSYYKQAIKSNIKASLKEVALQTSDGIAKLYEIAKKTNAYPENSSSLVLSSIELNYPEKVAGKNYEVNLVSSPGIWNVITNFTVNGKNVTIKKEMNSGGKVTVRTTQIPIIEYEYDLPNMPLLLEGSFRSGGNDTLRLVRFNYNGSVNDCVILGDSNLIVGITSIK